jgi:uncharacterized protein YjbJ (UPF0337 family)
MGTTDRGSNKVQDIKGKVEETVGHAAGNDDLEDKGKSDQAKSALKDVGESVKDAADRLKNVAK